MAEADKQVTYKMYTPHAYEKLTPLMQNMKEAQKDWFPENIMDDFDEKNGHEAWLDLSRKAGESSTKALSKYPTPDAAFGENLPYKKTLIGPIENELSCECTVLEPLEDNGQKKMMFIYVHGGGMAIFDGKGVFEWISVPYATEGNIAVNVHFTNSVDECYPRGLNDTISAIKYLATKYKDQVKGICIHGESGGANLVVAALMKLKQEEPEKDYVDCAYVACPYLYPFMGLSEEVFPTPKDIKSSIDEFAEGTPSYEVVPRAFYLAYKGPDKDEVEFLQDKFAWPYFAAEEDFKDFPPFYVMSNECDVLKEVGLRFYRQLIGAGVQAYHTIEAGTFHGSEANDMFYASMISKRRETFLTLVLNAKAEKKQAEAAAAKKEQDAKNAA